MLANRRRDTGPEIAVRRLVHAAGLRYRVDHPPLADFRRLRADLVFTAAKVAVFVDGCFWHGCPEHHRPARTNAAFWSGKIESNRQRDARMDALLDDAGWTVLRFWEHENPQEAAYRIVMAVQARRG
nr:very short patch repair endonuclease [Mycobacterium sp. UM_NZ2]